MASAPQQKLLLIEELVAQHGQPQEHPAFDPEHAVSYRTWLAISNFVAYHDPKLLNPLFQGIELPDMLLDQDTPHFATSIEDVITPETKAKYAHLKLNPRHYGSMQTRLRLFQNIVDATGNPTANFSVGRNIRVNRDMGPLKSTLQLGAKGLIKVLGVNPAKILQPAMPDANRALNSFLDTRLIQYGPNFMDVRIEYYNKADISPEGDHYTLGAILGGLETIAAYKQITIQALQTPFTQDQERIKHLFAVGEKGVRYTSENYQYTPDNPVFLYRYTFTQRAQFLRRVGRALGDFASSKLPSRISREQALQEEANRHILAQERELDLRQRREFEARIQAERSRADAAEALAASQQLQNENRLLSLGLKTKLETEARMKGIAHDMKSSANNTLVLLLPDIRNHLIGHKDLLQLCNIPAATIEYQGIDFGGYKDPLIQYLNQLDPTKSPQLKEHVPPHFESHINLLLHACDQIKNARVIMGTEEEQITLSEINIYHAVDDIIRYVRGMNKLNINILNEVPQNLIVCATEREYKSCLTNLIDNALLASENGKVRITGDYEGEITRLDIYQSGYLDPQIATKLNRGQAESSRKDHGGNGIGARTSFLIAKKHGGKLKYKSLGEQGALTQLFLDTKGYNPQAYSS